MTSEIEKKLESVKPRTLSSSERTTLWSNIQENIVAESFIKAHKDSRPGYFSMFHGFKRMRMVVATTLVALLFGGTAATVVLADSSLPGDLLFPIDLAAENIQLRLASPDNEDELRVQFASERLEEVKALLALANIDFELLSSIDAEKIVTATGVASSTSTSTEDTTATSTSDETVEETDEEIVEEVQEETSDDTSNSTSTESEETTDSTDDTDQENESDSNIDNDVPLINSEALERANDAFIIALQYLEDSRDSLLANGNDIAIIAIDAFIEELTLLANNHVTEIKNARIVVGNGPNDTERVNIAIRASLDDVVTEFNFREITKENGDTNSKIALETGTSEIFLKVNENRTVYEINNDIDDDDKDDDKNDKKDKKNDKHIDICYKKDSKSVKYSDLSKYLKKGAKFGKCHGDKDDNDDDDDDKDDDKDNNEKKVYICHEDHTIKVSYNAKPAHLRHGDSIGRCSDKDDDDDDDDGKDKEGPEISEIEIETGQTYAEVEWKTNEKANSKVWFSISSEVHPQSPTDFVSSGGFVEAHTLTINGLTPNTVYYYIIQSTDESGNTSKSEEKTFTTDSVPDPVDVTPPVITGVVINATTTEADISWSTNENTIGTFWFSSTSPVDVSGLSDGFESTDLKKLHSGSLMGLTPNSTYYYIIVAEDSVGNTSTSSEDSFITTALPPPPDEDAPVISELSVIPDISTSTITFTTDEPAKGVLHYSEISPVPLGALSIAFPSSGFATHHEVQIEGLDSGTTYYYVITIHDEDENEVMTSEESFETLSIDETAPIISDIDTSVATGTAMISWMTDEDATGAVHYSTSSPLVVDADSTQIELQNVLSDSHSVTLSSLQASSTYYFIVTSSDSLGNASTSSEMSFESI